MSGNKNNIVSNDGKGLELANYCGFCIDAGKGYFRFIHCSDCDAYVCKNCHVGDSEIDGRLTMNWKALEAQQNKENSAK